MPNWCTSKYEISVTKDKDLDVIENDLKTIIEGATWLGNLPLMHYDQDFEFRKLHDAYLKNPENEKLRKKLIDELDTSKILRDWMRKTYHKDPDCNLRGFIEDYSVDRKNKVLTIWSEDAWSDCFDLICFYVAHALGLTKVRVDIEAQETGNQYFVTSFEEDGNRFFVTVLPKSGTEEKLDKKELKELEKLVNSFEGQYVDCVRDREDLLKSSGASNIREYDKMVDAFNKDETKKCEIYLEYFQHVDPFIN